MNSSIKLIAYVKVYATFNTFVGLDPIVRQIILAFSGASIHDNTLLGYHGCDVWATCYPVSLFAHTAGRVNEILPSI